MSFILRQERRKSENKKKAAATNKEKRKKLDEVLTTTVTNVENKQTELIGRRVQQKFIARVSCSTTQWLLDTVYLSA